MTRRDAMVSMAGWVTAGFLPPAPRRIDLRPFCDVAPRSRYDLTAPFQLGGHVYASDAGICVRLDGGTHPAPTRDGPAPAADRLPWAAGSGWKSLRAAEPIPAAESDCPACRGYGSPAGPGADCGRCEGFGRVRDKPGRLDTMPADCPACGGHGFVPRLPLCSACGGKAVGVFPAVVRVGGAYFDARRYGLAVGLGADGVVVPWVAGGALLTFRFDGGAGLLLALNQESAERRVREAGAVC